MIKAILFDLDGVVTVAKTGSETIIDYIVENLSISKEKFADCYYHYNDELLLGTKTHQSIWKELGRNLGVELNYDILVQAFEATVLDETMLTLVERLHNDYKTALVTDNKADRIEVIAKKNHFETLFDQISVSAEIGSRKNEQEIFQITIDQLSVSAKECIFVDNSKRNLIVPQKMGMKTIWYDDETKDTKKLEEEITILCRNCGEMKSCS